MKILGLIPARGGSKGVPGKNHKKLAGKPLICHTIEAALASKVIDTLAVSTDDPVIRDISQAAGAEAPFLRPPELATDDSPTIDTVMHALAFYEKQGILFDALCLLQPTSPLRTPKDITEAVAVFRKSEADSLVSVREVPHTYNPHWVFEIAAGSPYLKIATGDSNIITRRQDLPKAYHRDGSIYITRTAILKKEKSLYGQKIAWHLSSNPYFVNIDNLSDWTKAEEIIASKKS